MGKFIFLNELYDEGSSENDSVSQAAAWFKGVLEETDEKESQVFEEKFSKAYEESDFDAIFEMFLEKRDIVFAQIDPEKKEKKEDVEGFFMVMLSLFMRDECQNIEDLAIKFCQAMVEKSENADIKVKVMMALFNMFRPNFSLRYPVFEYILDYCGKTGQFDRLKMYLGHLDEWLADWKLDVSKRRQLYLKLAEYTSNDQSSFYLKKHLELFNGTSDQELGSCVDVATKLVRNSLILPSVMQVDEVLLLDAVQHLRKTKDSALVELLDIFMHGSLDEFQAFHKKNGAIFTGAIDYEASLSKIRVLSLASLCHGKTELPLADISKALQVEDVETWIVQALALGVVDGRIDQIRQMLLIKSSLQREFKTEEWDFLDSRVDQWIVNIENLKKVIDQVQANNVLS